MIILSVALILALAAIVLTILGAKGKVPLWYAILALALLALLKAWPAIRY